MGMFDQKKYLTGTNGMFVAGDALTLHDAMLAGEVTINGDVRREAQLKVSRAGMGGDVSTVYSSGKAIVGQVERITDEDRRRMPMPVKLDQVDTGRGTPAFILVPDDGDAPF